MTIIHEIADGADDMGPCCVTLISAKSSKYEHGIVREDSVLRVVGNGEVINCNDKYDSGKNTAKR